MSEESSAITHPNASTGSMTSTDNASQHVKGRNRPRVIEPTREQQGTVCVLSRVACHRVNDVEIVADQRWQLYPLLAPDSNHPH